MFVCMGVGSLITHASFDWLTLAMYGGSVMAYVFFIDFALAAIRRRDWTLVSVAGSLIVSVGIAKWVMWAPVLKTNGGRICCAPFLASAIEYRAPSMHAAIAWFLMVYLSRRVIFASLASVFSSRRCDSLVGGGDDDSEYSDDGDDDVGTDGQSMRASADQTLEEGHGAYSSDHHREYAASSVSIGGAFFSGVSRIALHAFSAALVCSARLYFGFNQVSDLAIGLAIGCFFGGVLWQAQNMMEAAASKTHTS